MKAVLCALGAALFATGACAQSEPIGHATGEVCAGNNYLTYSCTPAQHRAAVGAIAYRELMDKIGQMVAAGNCTGAIEAALTAGRFDLSQQVSATCKAPTPQ